MGIYIPNKKIPKSCKECFANYDGWCQAIPYDEIEDINNRIPNECCYGGKGRADFCTLISASNMRFVVTCGECKFYSGRPWENNETGICSRTDFGVKKDDFCSYGKRSTNCDTDMREEQT